MKLSSCCVIGFTVISVLHYPVTYSVPIALIPNKVNPTAQLLLQETSFLTDDNQNNVKYNLIQSSEYKSPKEPDENDYAEIDKTQNHSKIDSSKAGGKTNLSKFYRNGYSPSSSSQTSEDSIIFPSTSSSFLSSTVTDHASEYAKETQTQTFSHVQLPRTDLASLYEEPVIRSGKPEADHHRHTILPIQTDHEPEEASYEELLTLLASLLAKFSEPAYSGIRRQILQPSQAVSSDAVAYSSVETNESLRNDKEATTVASTSSSTSQEVGHYSLYSGPKIKDAPCPPGQQRTHSGHCQGKSRRLANSSG